jgi:uncharacterized membrane protein YcaP (DUF421 family)
MDNVAKSIEFLLGLGLEAQKLHFWQMLLRALIVFFATLAIIRLAGRRFLARKSPFDVLLGFIMASMMARAINGSATFFGTLATGLFVALLYRTLAYVACRSKTIENWLKGQPDSIIRNGKVDERALRRHHVSHEDLSEDLRLNASTDDVERIRVAQIERNGEISVQCKSKSSD